MLAQTVLSKIESIKTSNVGVSYRFEKCWRNFPLFLSVRKMLAHFTVFVCRRTAGELTVLFQICKPEAPLKTQDGLHDRAELHALRRGDGPRGGDEALALNEDAVQVPLKSL